MRTVPSLQAERPLRSTVGNRLAPTTRPTASCRASGSASFRDFRLSGGIIRRMILPYGQQPPPDAIHCPMADEPRHAMCRLCDGRGWVQRDAAVAAFHARGRANAAARRRQPAKQPDPRRTRSRNRPPAPNSSHRCPRQRQRRPCRARRSPPNSRSATGSYTSGSPRAGSRAGPQWQRQPVAVDRRAGPHRPADHGAAGGLNRTGSAGGSAPPLVSPNLVPAIGRYPGPKTEL